MPIDHKNVTDPTYLRSIYDGLSVGSINKDNSTALPIGLVGIYEEAMPPASNVNERKKFLEFFAVWAILKKEVSAAFVLPLLEGWTEQEVIDFIGKYSKWFNSPVSGTYILYHERLRAFVQQKISHKQFIDCNDLLVKNAQAALIDKNGNEWERYALEYLSTHLLISAIETGEASELKNLAYDTSHWNRQIEISKGFEWSKSMLNDMMLWASKYVDDEVIECALNKVDLYHLEQNDAPRIVELVAQNDIETALNRIEAFGGNDKEGLQRKFILYMLCLMELTLLKSIEKPFRKEAIEKLLKHFNNHLPVDHSALNWNDFFPSQLIFQLIFVLIDLDLDFTAILKRTLRWGSYWKNSKIVNDDYLNALKTFSIELKDDLVFLEIISFLVQKVEIEEAFSFVEYIKDSYIKYRALIVISTKESIFIALEIGRNIPDFNMKCTTLLDISKEFYKKNMIEVGDSLINEIVALGMGIEDGFIRARNLITISSNVLEKGDLILSENLLNQSILITDELIDEISQSNLYLEIAIECTRNGKLLEANKIISRIKDKAYQNSALVEVISVLLKQGNFINAEELLEKIDDNREKNQALVSLAYEAAKIGNIDAVNNFIKTISSQNAREALFRKLAFEFAMKGNRDLSLYYAKNISYGIYRANVLIDVAVQFASTGLGEDAYSIIQESIVDASGISNNYSRGGVFMKIASELYVSGNVADSISAINEFLSNFAVQNSKDKEDLIFQKMSSEFLELGKLKESIAFAWRIDNYSKKITALFAIAKSLFKMNNIIESELILRETIDWINNQLNEDHKGIALYKISLEFAKRADFEKALEIARNISDQYNSSRSLLEISAEMYARKLDAESNSVLDESHRKMLNMDNFLWKGYALTDIAVEYARRGKIENSLICLQEISGDYRKENALCKISKELALLGKKIEAISYVHTINDFNLKSSALLEISKVFFEQNQCDDALKYLNEALSNTNMIEDESLKVTLLISIAIEFDKHNQFKEFLEVIMEAIKSARLIKNKIGFDYALTEISIQLAQRGCWRLIEVTVAEIYNHQMREDCWLKIAVSLNKNTDYYSMRKLINEFSNAESKIQMKQAIIRSVDEVNISKDICIHVLNDRSTSSDLTQHILQMYSRNQLFFTDAKPEKIQRFNRTLNIQWAIDIKNSLSANGS